eukprot:358645-Chlamydomonas_euryale.AAC.16
MSDGCGSLLEGSRGGMRRTTLGVAMRVGGRCVMTGGGAFRRIDISRRRLMYSVVCVGQGSMQAPLAKRVLSQGQHAGAPCQTCLEPRAACRRLFPNVPAAAVS